VNQALAKFQPIAHVLFRIVVGFLYWSHGAQKLVGWFGGFGPEGGTAELTSRFGVAAFIEFFGGLAIMLGLFTQPVAFIISGEMAVAYFWMHVGRSGQFWPWANRGEVVAFYSFAFLLLSTMGAGAFSVDARLKASRRTAVSPPGAAN
jgi:putative oxidoreductase